MPVAIHYSSVKTPPEAGKIYGLQVAVLDWLKAYLRYSHQETFPLLISDAQSLEEAKDAALSAGVDPARLIAYDGRFPKENFDKFSAIFRADSDPHDLLWQRCLAPNINFSFCGLSHAIAGLEGGEVLEKYCLGPSEATDAIICPSRAIQATIRTFWDIYADYIERRFGAKYRCPVQLPIIPLGIDAERMAAKATPEKRAAQRAQLGLGEKDIAVLWVGRLSHVIKAHPLAMFRAVEAAAKRTNARVHFLMVGYFVPENAAKQFQDLARDFCPTAKVSFIANNDPRFPDGLWAAGDIFLSLIDNMQESFGLTPIEAIAAGLPRVLSDWDGYRDSVQQGEDGFLVRTVQPPPGTGGDLSAVLLGKRELYGGFLAKTALSVAVDHTLATEALVALIENPDLRRRVADKAKQRLPHYEWRTIIPAYEALWDELAAQRRTAQSDSKSWEKWPAIPPRAPDPFTLYSAFPSSALKDSDRIGVIASAEEIKLLWGHEMNVLAFDMMVGAEDVAAILNWIGTQGRSTIGEVHQQFLALDTSRLWRTLGWLAKLGIIRVQ